MNRYNRKSDH